MRKILLLIIVISSLTQAAFPASDADLIRDAKSKFASGNVEESIKILDNMLAANPNNQQAKKVLADICVDTGEREYEAKNYKNAFDYFKKAIKLSPTHPIASERYWAMKNEFDVNSLKNEGQPIAMAKAEEAPEPEAAEAKEEKPAAIADAKSKPAAQTETKEKSAAAAEEEYLKRILQMEERFNKRMLEMASQSQKLMRLQKEGEKETAGFFYNLPDRKAIYTIILIAGLLSIAAIGFFINYMIKYIKKLKKERLGRKEYGERFGEETAPESYSELVKMQNIKEIINKIKSGDMDWSSVKKSISEMDRELRIDVLNMIENKLERERQPLTIGQADLLMCLLLDGDDYLRKRVSLFLGGQLGSGAPTPLKTQIVLPPPRADESRLLAYQPNPTLVENSIMEDLNIVIPLSKIIDRKVFKDNHSLKVGVDCYYFAGLLGQNPQECNLYYIAGLLHDIGFLDIPSELFNKRGALTEDEFQIIKTHTKKGLDLLDFTEIPQIIRDGIYYHHEKWDGGGYPEGLKKEEIPLAGQIVGLFDIYEALVLPRPQRPPFPQKEAVKIIKKGNNKLFNPGLMDLFERMVNENLLSREEIWKE